MSAPAAAVRMDDLVFVYGALRSGTTVFRLMLDAHPRIANPGEMDFLFDFLSEDPAAPGGWRYDLEALRRNRIFKASGLAIDPAAEGLSQLVGFLDQLRARHMTGGAEVLTINVHRNADRILAIAPEVRILHMLRDPRDVARSSIAMGWAGTLYHGVGHWIETEAAWDRVAGRIARGALLTITYEALFEDTAATLEAACGFLGVPYDPAMLRYHEATTYAAPDPSLVRQWRTKCDPREVAFLEHRAGPLMAARGYETTGPAAPAPGHRAALLLRDKGAVWRFGVRRFGAATYFGEKLARRVGWDGAHRALKGRMDEVVRQHLK